MYFSFNGGRLIDALPLSIVIGGACCFIWCEILSRIDAVLIYNSSISYIVMSDYALRMIVVHIFGNSYKFIWTLGVGGRIRDFCPSTFHGYENVIIWDQSISLVARMLSTLR